MTETAPVLSDPGRAAASFRDEGWTVVPDVIPPDDLTALRAACARFVRLREAEMDAAGTGDRRVYLAQYSAEPLLAADGAGLWQHAVPFLAGGALVADPAQVRDVPVPAVSPGGSSQW